MSDVVESLVHRWAIAEYGVPEELVRSRSKGACYEMERIRKFLNIAQETLQKENAKKDETIAKLRECIKSGVRSTKRSLQENEQLDKDYGDSATIQSVHCEKLQNEFLEKARETLKELEGVKSEP